MTSHRLTVNLTLLTAMVLFSALGRAQTCADTLEPIVLAYQTTAATIAEAAADVSIKSAFLTENPNSQAAKDAPATSTSALNEAQAKANAAQSEMARDLTLDRFAPCLVAAILANPLYKESIVARAKAAFQQNGSSSGSGGSTNIVSKGTAAQVLSVASEYGALTESVSGQTVTLSGTLAGIPTMLEQSNIMQPCKATFATGKCISPNLLNDLGRLSYSVAFAANQQSPQVSATSTTQSSTQPTTFTANYKAINAVTAKFVILKGASAKPADISKAVENLQTGSKNSLDDSAAQTALAQLDKDFGPGGPDLVKMWADAEMPVLMKTGQDGVASEVSSWSQSLPRVLCGSQTASCKLQADAESYAQAYFKYLEKQNTFIEGLRSTPVLTFEYDANLPASQPSNSTIRLIAGIPAGKSGLTITANGAGSFYDGTPSTTVPGARILRDYQVAAEVAYATLPDSD